MYLGACGGGKQRDLVKALALESVLESKFIARLLRASSEGLA
jgi:hypothetical protein